MSAHTALPKRATLVHCIADLHLVILSAIRAIVGHRDDGFVPRKAAIHVSGRLDALNPVGHG